MLPDPLHPAVVHLPLALAVLLPAVSLLAWWQVRGGQSLRLVWGPVVAGCVLLAASCWLALETGQDQEDRVERVVSEAAVDAHEERAEVLLTAAVIAAVLAVAGLRGDALGRIARGLTLAACLGVLVAAVRVGASGGELVYRHGAASAYNTPAARALQEDAGADAGRLEGDDDD